MSIVERGFTKTDRDQRSYPDQNKKARAERGPLIQSDGTLDPSD